MRQYVDLRCTALRTFSRLSLVAVVGFLKSIILCGALHPFPNLAFAASTMWLLFFGCLYATVFWHIIGCGLGGCSSKASRCQTLGCKIQDTY